MPYDLQLANESQTYQHQVCVHLQQVRYKLRRNPWSLAFRDSQVTENIVAWNLLVGGVKQIDNQSHCILFNFLLLVQIPEAKLDYIKSSE